MNIDRWPHSFGEDYGYAILGAHRFLSGVPLYEPYQLAGPYVTAPGDFMYPPTSLLLFVPFAFLPEALWYAIPLALLAYGIWRAKPGPWRRIGILWCLAFPSTITTVWTGNPVIWCAAFLALGGPWSVGVLLKPSVFPFAFLGIRDRRWWVAMAGLGVVALLTLPACLDWLRVVVNARGPWSGLLYSLGNVPLLLAVVIGCRPLRVPTAGPRNAPKPATN